MITDSLIYVHNYAMSNKILKLVNYIITIMY